MTDRWTDRLSDYVDAQMASEEARSLEEHLLSCPACTRTLAELRTVVAQAQDLEPRPPTRDLWPEIAARIHEAPSVSPHGERTRRRFRLPRMTFTVPQLAAAAIALTLMSGTAVWFFAPGRNFSGGGDRGIVSRVSELGGPATASWTRPLGGNASTAARYQAAIADLEEALFRGEQTLDTATVRKLSHSLGIIDRAIVEARRALEQDPANSYLNQHVAETMRKKVEFMQTAALGLAGT